jgi:hypothetical protein
MNFAMCWRAFDSEAATMRRAVQGWWLCRFAICPATTWPPGPILAGHVWPVGQVRVGVQPSSEATTFPVTCPPSTMNSLPVE